MGEHWDVHDRTDHSHQVETVVGWRVLDTVRLRTSDVTAWPDLVAGNWTRDADLHDLADGLAPEGTHHAPRPSAS